MHNFGTSQRVKIKFGVEVLDWRLCCHPDLQNLQEYASTKSLSAIYYLKYSVQRLKTLKQGFKPKTKYINKASKGTKNQNYSENQQNLAIFSHG